MISTKGRYALKVMVELAEHDAEEYIPLKGIAEKLNISQKYLESISTILSKGHMIEGVSGKKGGYRLNRKPEEYRVGDILRLTEGTLAPVSCLREDQEPCEKSDSWNYRIPKAKHESAEELTYEECMEIIKAAPEPKARGRKKS